LPKHHLPQKPKPSQQGQWHPGGKERNLLAPMMVQVESKQHQETTTSNLTLQNNGVGINIFSLKPLHPCRYPDSHTMNVLEIRDNVVRFLNKLNWVEIRDNVASSIHNPVFRYLQRVMACTIWGRKEVGTTRTYELFMLWAMLNDQPVNTWYYLLDYLAFVGTKSDDVSDIVVGGIITFIARKFGVGEDQEINRIEGHNILNIDTLIAMNFIKPHPPDNMTYELKLNVTLCLFILLNPSRTDTGVEENFLYVGDGPQVHEEHNVVEEEGAHLHDNVEHHDHGAGENYNEDNDRWAWMQTEVQRISTEPQRQGVEIFGLRNDVQSSNRVNDENNQMLRMMMQHLHLQGPPYGPQ